MKHIENIIKSKNIKKLTDQLFNENFPWFFVNKTSPVNQQNMKNIFEYYSFVHWFVMDSKVNSTYHKYSINIIKDAPINHNGILRAKINLLPKVEHNKDKYNTPHVDLEYRKDIKYKSCIIYLNDSDGDTFIFNNKKEIIKRITPKKGDVLILEGNQIHASSHPIKTDYRLVLNINYVY